MYPESEPIREDYVEVSKDSKGKASQIYFPGA